MALDFFAGCIGGEISFFRRKCHMKKKKGCKNICHAFVKIEKKCSQQLVAFFVLTIKNTMDLTCSEIPSETRVFSFANVLKPLHFNINRIYYFFELIARKA